MINLISVIAWKYPTKKVSLVGDDWSDYSLIDWGSEAVISEAQLLLDAVDHAKYIKSETVRTEAGEQRLLSTKAYLGTIDPEQIRTYEEKYLEAMAYLANNASPTPIMTGEIAATGETLATLAPLVKMQYEYLKNLLKISYGNIEGRRRVMIAQIQALTTVDAANNYVINWSA